MLGSVAVFGALWFLSRPRFRVRSALAAPPGYRRATRAFASATAITVAGMTLLVARAAGGPAWLGTVGAGVSLAGFTALAVSLVVLLRERFRDTRRRESRPAV
jgi:hypothetical protein